MSPTAKALERELPWPGEYVHDRAMLQLVTAATGHALWLGSRHLGLPTRTARRNFGRHPKVTPQRINRVTSRHQHITKDLKIQSAPTCA